MGCLSRNLIKLKLLFVFSCLPLVLQALVLSSSESAERYPIIPKPALLTPAKGNFSWDYPTNLFLSPYNDEMKELAEFLIDTLNIDKDLPIKTPKSPTAFPGSSISLILDKDQRGPEEGYELFVKSKEIVIRSKSLTGLFWAIQTLRQITERSADRLLIPCVKIVDHPRFSYRGLHLDVARHMYSTEFIKKYIDLMSLYKLNRFHWHLTDDQGWRIESKVYPKLNEISAYRKETLIGHLQNQEHQFDEQPYGGYYTQEEIREIVAYAKKRHVTIIPEMDLPGHVSALLAAYPELGCTKEVVETATSWGIFDHALCIGNRKVFTFVENLLREVMDLFPGPWIHIGGDEVKTEHWEHCAKCQFLMQKENLEKASDLQGYFNHKIGVFLKSHNRTLIGWEEILDKNLHPSSIIMSWKGTEEALKAIDQKHTCIMTSHNKLYFDYYQSEEPDRPLAIGGYTPLHSVYQYEPLFDHLSKSQQTHVLGAQGNVWTEYMPTERQVEYMVFPRALALSEVVWSAKEVRNYTDFRNRLEMHLQMLRAKDVAFYYPEEK